MSTVVIRKGASNEQGRFAHLGMDLEGNAYDLVNVAQFVPK